MKTLSLARPLILMVVGLPGAGKTFFAMQFSDMFNAPLVGIDRMRFELFGDPSYNANEQDLLQRIGDYQMGELVKTSRSFIVDGYCNARTERQKLEAFARRNGYDTLVVWVQTDAATSERRATKRNPKKTGDSHNYSLTHDQYQGLSKRFTAPTKESYVVISGKHTFATQAKMVLRKLTSAHTQAAEQAHAVTKVSRPVQPRPRDTPNPRASRNVIIR